jgi:hypothetical protein
LLISWGHANYYTTSLQLTFPECFINMFIEEYPLPRTRTHQFD